MCIVYLISTLGKGANIWALLLTCINWNTSIDK